MVLAVQVPPMASMEFVEYQYIFVMLISVCFVPIIGKIKNSRLKSYAVE